MKGVFAQIYQLTAQIPQGKVSTYGRLAQKLKLNPQVIGWALHANRNRQIPCHRVVNQKGRVAANYGFGGGVVQKKKLQAEGIYFKTKWCVDLTKHLW